MNWHFDFQPFYHSYLLLLLMTAAAVVTVLLAWSLFSHWPDDEE